MAQAGPIRGGGGVAVSHLKSDAFDDMQRVNDIA